VPILSFRDVTPEVGVGVALAEQAVIVGKVRVAGPAVLGQSAVLRGDQNWISVGPRFRMGERSSIHVELDTDAVDDMAPPLRQQIESSVKCNLIT